MMSFSGSFYRWSYYIMMYSGLRAAYNHIRGKMTATRSALGHLHGTTLSAGDDGILRFFVHSRPRPAHYTGEAHFGMISIRQQRPPLDRLLYKYLCLTSHFGCGHVEMAYYELHGKVMIYAVRNIASANALRLKLIQTARCLDAYGWHERLLPHIVRYVGRHGLTVGPAPIDDCLRLAVSLRLIHPQTRSRSLRTLTRKSKRLRRILEAIADRSDKPPGDAG